MNHNYSINDLLLKAENVSLKYSGNYILRNVNFEIHDIIRPDAIQGQVVSIVGKSGMGKTLLLKIIAGLLQPDSGSIKVGTDQHPVMAGEIGMVAQNYILFDHRTVYQNLEIGLNHSPKKYCEKEKMEIIREYSVQFDLLEHLEKYPSQLSGGQKQRVSIIQQVLTGNRFILLDEPFSGLDILMIDKVTELLIKISNTNELNTLIIVSHDIINSLALSDTVFVLSQMPGPEGSTITEKIDLMQLGLAWEPDVKINPLFMKLIKDIKNKL